MKRFLALVLALVMLLGVVGLTACDEQNDDKKEETTVVETDEKTEETTGAKAEGKTYDIDVDFDGEGVIYSKDGIIIEFLSSDGENDTYKLTTASGDTYNFTLSRNAKDGKDGEKGADGLTPRIGENGNWWIGDTDTGVKAQGAQGEKGDTGAQGEKGEKGDTGAQGEKGEKGDTGAQGEKGDKGEQGIQGDKGDKGDAGVSIVNAYVNSGLHLIIVLSNGNEIDAGYVGVEIIPTVTTYTVTFKDYDGSILKTEKVEKNKGATAPVDPQRAGYVFKGWDTPFNNVESDLIVTAVYEEIKTPTLLANSVNAKKTSGTVKVSINILNNPGISSLKFKVSYDDAVLELENVEFNSAFGSYVTSPVPYKNPQSVSMISPLANIDASGEFVTFTFKINGNAKIGDVSDIVILLDKENTFDENFDEVDFSIVNGKVTIE